MVIRKNIVYIQTHMHWQENLSKVFFFVSEKDQSENNL